MKKAIRAIIRLMIVSLRFFGIELIPWSGTAALKRTSQRNLNINTFFDIGASDGRWTRTARKFFPKAKFFLVEARKEHEKGLAKLKGTVSNVDYVIAAAGEKDGDIYFDATDLFGGLASNSPVGSNCIKIPSVSIDSIVDRYKLKGPFALKLDTHGFEGPIFAGAKRVLKDCTLIIVESYNFNLGVEAMRFHEMCKFLEAEGFRCIDICDPGWRPLDNAFWQIDLIFVRSSNEAFKYNVHSLQEIT